MKISPNIFPRSYDDIPAFKKDKITGKAKVCDGRTGECWEVKDSGPKTTPPVKKNPPDKKTKTNQKN